MSDKYVTVKFVNRKITDEEFPISKVAFFIDDLYEFAKLLSAWMLSKHIVFNGDEKIEPNQPYVDGNGNMAAQFIANFKEQYPSMCMIPYDDAATPGDNDYELVFKDTNWFFRKDPIKVDECYTVRLAKREGGNVFTGTPSAFQKFVEYSGSEGF